MKNTKNDENFLKRLFLSGFWIIVELIKIVENFCALKLIRLPQDIFSLDFDKIEKLDGWGKLSISNLKYSIHAVPGVNIQDSTTVIIGIYKVPEA